MLLYPKRREVVNRFCFSANQNISNLTGLMGRHTVMESLRYSPGSKDSETVPH